MFVFTPYLVPLRAGRAGSTAAESKRAGWCVPTTAWSPFYTLPKPRLKFPSAEVAICLIAEVT